MSSKRWLLVSSLGLSLAIACAKADEQNPDENDGSGDRTGGGATSGSAGKSSVAGSSTVSEGGKSGSAAGSATGGTSSGNGGKAGSSSGGAHAGSGGNANGGSGGKAGAGGSGGNANGGNVNGGKGGSGGTSTGGTGSNGVGCNVEAAAGAASVDGSAAGAAAIDDSFFDDFETGAATKWTTTLGTWAVVDDDSKAYAQSVQENKVQIAIANGVCAADQIIDARIKVVGFKGQSSSYVAALFGRVVSPTTHYLLALGSDDKLILRKRVNSSSTGATAIGSAKTLTLAAGQWYDVHFEIVGSSLKGCVGDVCVTGTDSSIASGSVGVGSVNTSARFDEVRVTAP